MEATSCFSSHRMRERGFQMRPRECITRGKPPPNIGNILDTWIILFGWLPKKGQSGMLVESLRDASLLDCLPRKWDLPSGCLWPFMSTPQPSYTRMSPPIRKLMNGWTFSQDRWSNFAREVIILNESIYYGGTRVISSACEKVHPFINFRIGGSRRRAKAGCSWNR